MKNLKLVLVAMVVFAAVTIVSCKDNKSETKVETTTEEQGKEYTSAYVCPMHCEGSGSDEEGNCPVCGMDYVLNEDHKDDGHKHD